MTSPANTTMRSSQVILSASVLLLLLLLLPHCKAAIQCSDVVKDLTPCIKYLSNGTGNPPSACCTGANKLSKAASTSADRKAACSCIQTAAKKINPKDAAAKGLAGNCGITLPFTISSNMDCSKIS